MRVKKFLELNLSLKELDKSTGDKKRGDILIDFLSTGKELLFKPKVGFGGSHEVQNSGEIIASITDSEGNYDSNKAKSYFKSGNRYLKRIRSRNDNRLYQLNDIEKTEDFGSSGGSSLGTKETRIVECIQCLFLSLRQDLLRKIELDDIDLLYDNEDEATIRRELLERIKVPIEIDRDLIEKYDKWYNTFINTANSLYENKPIYTKEKSKYDSILDENKKYDFYQIGYGKEFTRILTEAYRKCPETIGIPISKWTPSDIWVIETYEVERVSNSIFESRNISILNRKINLFFEEKKLRGISLKKLKEVNDVSEIKLVINKLTPVPNYRLKYITTSKNSLGSIGVNIFVDQLSPISEENIIQNMNLRSFSGPDFISDISGEILGSSARHGKIGLIRINKILEDVFRRNNKRPDLIETKMELMSLSDDILMDKVEKLNEKVKKFGKSIGNKESQYTRARGISKYQSLRFCEIILDNYNLSNEIIETMFYYAMAIRNDKFISPKYVRII